MTELPQFRDLARPKFRWLFPLVAGLTWFCTLTILVVYWLVRGRPQYPGQSNPYVAFISDIAAFNLKPVFIIGCTITAITFALTAISIHFARYSAECYGLSDDARWRKAASAFGMLCGLAASAALFLLTIFDTYRHHKEHVSLLLICFGGLGVSSVTTSVVWFEQTWKPSKWDGLQRWCVISNVLVVIGITLAVAFNVLLARSWMHTAGVLEWALTYTGAFWLLTFVGYFRDIEVAVEAAVEEEEERPLLASRDE